MEKSPPIKVHRVTDPLLSFFFFLGGGGGGSTFNFSQTVGEMVFVSFEVEKMRMFLVQSIVRWCWVLVRSWGAIVSFVKPLTKVWFQLAPVSCRAVDNKPPCFMHGHGRAAFHLLLQILLLFQILGHRCRIFQGIKDPPF